MLFYVINTDDNSVSWPARENAERGEKFETRKAAEKRAKELASSEPGKQFNIVQLVATVSCPVGKAQVVSA